MPRASGASTTPMLAKSERRCNSSHGIDYCGDSGVGGTRNRKSLFDGAHTGDQKMLVRPRPGTEPGIVGHVDQPARALTGCHCTGKNYFIADQGRDLGRARNCVDVRAVAGGKAALTCCQFGDPDVPEQILERHIFAERHQMEFVVDRFGLSAGAEYIEGIVIADLMAPGGRRAPRR